MKRSPALAVFPMALGSPLLVFAGALALLFAGVAGAQ